MIRKQSAAKGFTILGAASILNKVLSIIYVPILTQLIGDVGNGIANAGYVVYLLVFQITYMGIPVAISKMVSEQVTLGRYQDSAKTLKVSAILLISLGTVLSLATAFGAGWIARAVGRPESAMTLLALSPTVLFASFSATFRGYFQGRHNMSPTSMSQILEQAINTVFTIIFAWLMLRVGLGRAAAAGITDPAQARLFSLQYGAAGSAMATTLGAVVSTVYLTWVYRRNRQAIRQELAEERQAFPQREYKPLKELARQVVRYALPVIMGVTIVYSANIVDLTFTNHRLLDAGFDKNQAAALYGILTTQYGKIINVPLALANTLAMVMLPGISSIAASMDRRALNSKITKGLKVMFLITLPSAAMLSVLAEPVIHLLFPGHVSGIDLMQMGSWVIVLTAFVQLQTSILQGMGRMQLPTIHMAIALVAKIIVNFVLIGIASVNIRGAVIGSLVCYGLAGLLNYLKIKSLAGYRAPWNRLLIAPVLASIAMTLVAWASWHGLDALVKPLVSSAYLQNLIATLPAMTLGGTAYVVAVLALKGMSREELYAIPLVGKLMRKKPAAKLLIMLKVK